MQQLLGGMRLGSLAGLLVAERGSRQLGRGLEAEPGQRQATVPLRLASPRPSCRREPAWENRLARAAGVRAAD